jgi:hypothetical protein
MEIHNINETPLGKFAEDLKAIMIFHNIKSMTPNSLEMEISLDEENNLKIYWVNFKTKEEEI